MANVRKILLAGVPLCFAGVFAVMLVFREYRAGKLIANMEERLEEARKREEKAVMIRSVSRQMEEIAYQQKGISDRQRKEAEVQAAENYRMKLRVEEEWKRAVKAQEEAVKAYRLADGQKALAEERQIQAEYAKRVADTLAYLTLGRSLGSFSVTQYKAGNYDVASLLAYASWSFVKRYHGDIFLPSVFNALSLSSGQLSVWQKHKGGITSIVLPSGTEKHSVLYTFSKYGEILVWKKDSSGTCQPEILLADPQYDFRAACVGIDGSLQALSYDGRVLRLSEEEHPRIFATEGKGYVGMLQWGDKTLLLSISGDILFGGSREKFCDLADVTCMCVAKDGHGLFVGCKNGDVFLTDTAGNKKKLGNYYRAAVTALCHSPERGVLAVGYVDGTLLLTGTDRGVIRLVAHRAAISGICILKDKLYSCSYDRTLRLWSLTAERKEAVTVLESSSWLLTMATDLDGNVLFAGDGSGNFYRMSVSPDSMATRIRYKLPRNFTPEEWTYYMGNRIPFEAYVPELAH